MRDQLRTGRGLDLPAIAGVLNGEVRGDALIDDVSVDSQACRPGVLFCAVRGTARDGHLFAEDAVAHGASALLVEHWLPLPVPQIRVPWARLAAGLAAAAVHGRPSAQMDVVGVTGTNGKTTTTYLLHAALGAGGRRPGMIGTVEVRWPGGSQPAGLTTPASTTLQRMLARMRDDGVDSVVLEASSQGLDQQRLTGTQFALGVFLNLGHDHLDYHGTVEHYYASKAILFEPDLSRHGLVCIDDEWGRRLAYQARIPVTTFGVSAGGDVRVEVLKTGLDGTRVRLVGVDGDPELAAPVIGAVNAANIAAAYLAARHLGVDPDAAAAGLAGCELVPGRFQLVDHGQPFLVVVDYAHTPDALAHLLRTARDLTAPGGRVHLVVGSRGGKDRMKRPLTGRVAGTADHPVITTDSPGNEDPAGIVEQIMVGTLDVPSGHVEAEPDRRRAIRHVVATAAPGDVVVITGRGHEPTRRVGDVNEAFDDREEAAEALRARGYSSPVRGDRPHPAPQLSPVLSGWLRSTTDRGGADRSRAAGYRPRRPGPG